MKSLDMLCKRWLPPVERKEALFSLPPEVKAHLAQGNVPILFGWLRQQLKSEPNSRLFPALIETARQYGLAERDIDKLEALGHHGLGMHAQAYQLAARYSSGCEFDDDLFVIAVLSLYYMNRHEEAYSLLGTADWARLENRADLANIAALACAAVGNLDEMKRHIDRARRLAPDDPNVAANALEMYFELGDCEAFGCTREDIRHGGHASDQIDVSLAMTELAQDRYEEGFRLLESRYRLPQYRHQMNPALFERPRWQGEPLDGRMLLVSAEQGLGDTIQFARFLPELLRRANGRMVLETPPETITLLQSGFPDVPMVPHRHGVMPATHFDCWAAAMSLPYLLGTAAGSIPGRSGYLRAPYESMDYWRGRVDALSPLRRPRIGLAWSGKPIHPADRRRSIPFSQIAEMIGIVEADFFALQTLVPAARPANLFDVSEELLTLADTAALAERMDLVISIDSCPVHLAGAMGKETWLLLPYRYEWRWGLEGEGNRWYDSVRVLRQRSHGDWAGLLHEVFEWRLQAWLAKRQAQ